MDSESAIRRAQRIRHEADAALNKTNPGVRSLSSSATTQWKKSNADVSGIKKAVYGFQSGLKNSTMESISGKHDLNLSMRNIQRSEQKTEMRQKLGSFLSNIKKQKATPPPSPSIGPAIVPTTTDQAFQILHGDVHLPNSVEAIKFLSEYVTRHKELEGQRIIDLKHAQEQAVKLREELSNERLELSRKSSRLEILEQRMQSIEQAEREHTSVIDRMKAAHATLKKELDFSTAQLKEVQEQNDRLRQQTRTISTDSRADVEKTKHDLLWTQNELDSMRQQYRDLQKENEVLAKQLQDKSDAASEVFEKFKLENHQLRKSVGELKVALSSCESENRQINSLKDEIDALRGSGKSMLDMERKKFSEQEARMADIIAWLLELHNDSEHGDEVVDTQAAEMLRELRQVYRHEINFGVLSQEDSSHTFKNSLNNH